MGLGERLLNFLYNDDRAINSLWGGRKNETISGTVGRAAWAGKWWAVYLAQPIVNFIMRNPHHCAEAAAYEAAQRAKGND